MFCESRRQRCLNVDWLSREGMGKAEKLGVQEVASIARQAGEVFKGLAGCAVERIAYQGMADGGQVDPDLVGAAGMQGDLKGGGAGGAGDDRR